MEPQSKSKTDEKPDLISLKDELISLLEKRRKSGGYENPYAVAEIIEAIEVYGDYDTDDLHKWVQSLFSM